MAARPNSVLTAEHYTKITQPTRSSSSSFDGAPSSSSVPGFAQLLESPAVHSRDAVRISVK
jgi:hypothetical protein